MSIEPQCNFCDEITKFRCKTKEKAIACESYIAKDKIMSAVKKTMEKPKMTMTTNMKNLSDISGRSARSIVAMIDALSQRGAFKGEELLTIGQLREQQAQIIRLSEAIQSEENSGSATE